MEQREKNLHKKIIIFVSQQIVVREQSNATKNEIKSGDKWNCKATAY